MYTNLLDSEFQLAQNGKDTYLLKWERPEPKPDLTNLNKYQEAISTINTNQEKLKTLIEKRESYNWYYIRSIRDKNAIVPTDIDTLVENLQSRIDALQTETDALINSIIKEVNIN